MRPPYSKLLELAQHSASANSQDVLKTLVVAAAELTGSQFASILLPAPNEENQLRFVACLPAHSQALESTAVPLESSIAGWVFQHGQAMFVHNAQEEARIYREIEQQLGMFTLNLAAAPLIFNNQTLGVLETINKLDGNYQHEDLQILEVLAAYAAVHIHNQRLNTENAQLHQQFEKLERMKRDFIAIASHELRTPLGLVLGHATFLREIIEDPEAKEQVQAIIRSSLRLKEIVEVLSKMDNYQTGMALIRNRAIALDELVREIAQSYAEQTRRKNLNILFEMQSQPVELTVEGDPDKIAVAVNNVFQNAVMFTDENGTIHVTLKKIPGYVRLTIQDSGIGIPKNDLERIFERFYQVESHMTRRHGGMGLGLSVAKAMIEMHGGRIWAESTPGQGSTFTIMLPALAA
ncbi:MAG: hypothetical protein OHK0052_14870 [Anaerolineales bacterium]